MHHPACPHQHRATRPRSPARRLRPVLMKAHRWLSLAMMVLWLLQALTGVICVFHWELDDATIAAPAVPLDLVRVSAHLERLAPRGSGRTVVEMWTSAGVGDRWDVTLAGRDPAIVRIDGAGRTLRVRRAGERLADGGLLDTLDNLHQTLLAGDPGGWIIGLSGLLLVSNLLMGALAAWPRGGHARGKWRRALTPPRRGALAARLHGWHRALGLAIVAPVLLLVSAGVLRAFSDGFQELIGAALPAPPAIKPGASGIALARAVEAALHARPRARLAAVIFPQPGDAVWTIRLVEPGELSRAYGQSRVYVDGRDGRVIGAWDAPAASWRYRLADAVLPVHTGEAAGTGGRVLVMLLGTGLAAMIALGASLWWQRRRQRRDS